MIKFPETAASEWQIIADAANVEKDLRARIKRDTLVEVELDKLRVRHQAAEAFQQELDADNTPALEMFTVDQFNKTPSMAPSDLIEGTMKENGLFTVMGPSGSGKSTLALQAIYCLLAGEHFLGRVTQKIDGAAGVLSYDMDGGLMADWMAGFPGIDMSKMSVVNAYRRGNPLAVPAMRAQIVAAWKALNVQVVMVDSFSASFTGESQNDTAATMAHYRDLMRFALTEVGARGIIVITHSTSGSPHKIRGSSAHHDTADSITAVVADNETGLREVRSVKYRQHRTTAGVMSEEAVPVMIGAPDPVTHLVSIDASGMVLKEMTPPAGLDADTLFPDTNEDPDTTVDNSEEDDL